MEKMIILDLETQSFAVESGIYEVACLAIENFEVVDKLYLGILDDSYEGSRKYGYGFYDISSNTVEISKFRKFLAEYPYPLVAHNCAFDKKFLDYYGWLEEERDFYCSMRAIRNEVKDLHSYSLGKLILHYKLGRGAKHTAFEDVEHLNNLLNIVRPKTWYKIGVKQPKKKKGARNKDELESQYTISEALSGEWICFTGKSKYVRSKMQEIAIINGAEITSSILQKTTMLVVGEDAGSKLDKAQEKELNIISDDEFMELVGNNIID
ncbi:BRCT domain-containing protein [Listeria ilorinensis]|uniref:BRCT domain-containing protein n=1 Tax=Listeria ilorinensis TaxID=2867439 RepID=UPI001EF66350|nr:BRCT domain-containing protein [Listeria ilorinensis]